MVVVPPTDAEAAQCRRVGQKRSQLIWIGSMPTGRQAQICTRVGKRLVWKVFQPKSESKDESLQVDRIPETSIGLFSEVANCQVTASSGPGKVLSDPPYSTNGYRLSSLGTVRVLMLPVDFVDAPAKSTSNPEIDFTDSMKNLVEYFSRLSSERLSIRVSTLPAYIRMDGSLESWRLGGSWRNRDQRSFVRDVVRATDPWVDFTGIDYLIVAPAPTYSLAQISSGREGLIFHDDSPLVTDEGRIRFANIDSTWQSNAHEISHSFGLPDLYDIDSLGSGNSIGLFQYVGNWDHMSSLANRGLLGWNRYFLGWLDQAEVKCVVGPGTRRLKLRTLGSPTTKPELLLLRGESGAVLGIEVRRFDPVTDSFAKPSTQGVLAYSIDNTRGHARGTVSVLGPGADPSMFHASAPLRPGQSLKADGWTIKVLDSDGAGDLVEVSKD